MLAEIDCTPATVNRKIENGYAGPRVTKVIAVDVGLPINPLGLEAQMQGGVMDGIAQALTYSLHFQDGHYLEGSWDNAYYTRQWNVPPECSRISDHHAARPPRARRRGRARVRAVDGGGRVRLRRGDRNGADELPDQPQRAARVHPAADRAADTAVAHQRPVQEEF